MNHSKATYRYFILAEQFFIDEKNPFYPILHEPLKRFFSYIYHHTNIWYLNFITEEEIYGYICYHRNNDFQFISFEQTIIDVKLYLFS